MMGTLAIGAPGFTAPAPAAPIPNGPSATIATIQQNPLPRPELNAAANLLDIVPESTAIARELHPDDRPTVLSVINAHPDSADDRPEPETNFWQQSPAMLPPPEPIPETVPAPEAAPVAIPLSIPRTTAPSGTDPNPTNPDSTNPTSAAPASPPSAIVTQTPPPIRAAERDDDLGSLPIRPIPPNDDDFGELPVRLLPPPPPPPPKWLFVTGQAGYFSTSNSFFTTTKIADQGIRTGLTLTALVPLGPKTYFSGAIDGNLVRNLTFSRQSYDELRVRAGILQQLSPRMFGELGWSNQKLYAAQNELRGILSGDRFLNENSLRLDLSRTDPIDQRLSLISFYQLRWSLSSREQSDRLSNTIYTSLNYKLSPQWTAGLDYVMSWSHYTQVARDEVFQQVQLRTRYAINPSFSMNLVGGFSFGGTSDKRRQFGLNNDERLHYDGWSIGVNFVYSKGLF
jgi:hypothetical protein